VGCLITVYMLRPSSHDSVGRVEGDLYSLHLFIFFLSFAFTALSTGATVLTDHLGALPALHALFRVLVLHEHHFLFLDLMNARPLCFFGV
jgi:hypothetical protein